VNSVHEFNTQKVMICVMLLLLTYLSKNIKGLIHRSSLSYASLVRNGNLNAHRFRTILRTTDVKVKSTKVNSLKSAESDEVYPFNRNNIPDETLFILDGTSLIFKAYHSKMSFEHPECFLSDFIVEQLRIEHNFTNFGGVLHSPFSVIRSDLNVSLSSTHPVNGSKLTAVTSYFVRLIQTIRPRYLVVVFDSGGPTFRNEIYPDYKKHRPQVRPQLP
jgi:hypothetical protein